MVIILLLIAAAFYLMGTTWVFYLALVNVQKVEEAGQLPTIAKFFALPLLAFGVGLDWLLNTTVGSLLFWEWPQWFNRREFLLTTRLERWHNDTGWRGKRARWICTNFLDRFAPGGIHCR